MSVEWFSEDQKEKIAVYGGVYVTKHQAEQLGNDPKVICALFHERLDDLKRRVTVAEIERALRGGKAVD